MTFAELIAVIALAAALLLVGLLSVYRGRQTAKALACQDNMEAIHAALEIYWTKNDRTYPADQAAFEQFLQDRVYFPEELRCPLDDDGTHPYSYSYDPVTNPGPEGVTISCSVPGSGHGSR
jgi:type II secretory pathway pseudopilin PulG